MSARLERWLVDEGTLSVNTVKYNIRACLWCFAICWRSKVQDHSHQMSIAVFLPFPTIFTRCHAAWRPMLHWDGRWKGGRVTEMYILKHYVVLQCFLTFGHKFTEVCDGGWPDVASRTFLLYTVSSAADGKRWLSREGRSYSLPVS